MLTPTPTEKDLLIKKIDELKKTPFPFSNKYYNDVLKKTVNLNTEQYKEVILTPDVLNNANDFPMYEIVPQPGENKYIVPSKMALEFLPGTASYEIADWEEYNGNAGLFWWRVDDPNEPGGEPEPVEVTCMPLFPFQLTVLQFNSITIDTYNSIHFLSSKNELIPREMFEQWSLLNTGISFGQWSYAPEPFQGQPWSDGNGSLRIKLWYNVITFGS